MTQIEKGQAFRALHQRDNSFYYSQSVGHWAVRGYWLTSALKRWPLPVAVTLALWDGPTMAIGRDAMIAHVSVLASATDLPLSADLENGFGDAPEAAAVFIRSWRQPRALLAAPSKIQPARRG